ncbi:MAG: tyrosine-type recombinase/integrase [Saprospiraceae bacterium]
MASVKIVLKPNKATTTGDIPIYIRITHQRKAKFISLGIKVNPEKNWNVEAQRVKRNYPNSGRVNKYIATKLAEAEAVALELATKPSNYTSEAIKEQIMGKPPECFLTYGDKQVARLEKSEQVRTAIRYKLVIGKMRKYLNGKSFTFDDLTVSFLHEYEAHLKSIGNHVNTVHTNLKTIRAILYLGIREDVFPQAKNPFFKFKLKSVPTSKERLSLVEIERIANLPLDNTKIIGHARNAFMFSFYCAGIRVSDLFQLRWSNINDNFLSYKMGKTGAFRKIKLIFQANDILNIYRESNPTNEDFIFPFLDKSEDLSDKKYLVKRLGGRTTKINQKLKIIANRANISKKLTTHIARHSFADIARKKGVGIYDISKALGHTNIAITQAYLASFDDGSLENAMERIFG